MVIRMLKLLSYDIPSFLSEAHYHSQGSDDLNSYDVLGLNSSLLPEFSKGRDHICISFAYSMTGA
jgi:hypothetical protein